MVKLRKRLLQKLTKHPRLTDLFTDRALLMSDTNTKENDQNGSQPPPTAAAPTYAAFSPNQQTASRTQNQQSILIHQKSPLLISTPPQVTRALAYSHPFILPLNHVAGILAWNTGDPWESFLALTCFWFVVLYGDPILRWAAPVVLVAGLVFGMYTRRYSPLSSSVWSSDSKRKRKRAESEQRKSLDEILETLREFTERCDVLLDPFLRLTEYLSTQSTATSATTRPALTTLFIRILAFTPIWVILTLPPLNIITTRRILLVTGTLILSWHSPPARVSRTILWRSQTIRKAVTLLTGLHLPANTSPTPPPTLPTRPQDAAAKAKAGKHHRRTTSRSDPIRFTFTLYENQRRWLGLGWTTSLFAYERQAWTDEHLNDVPLPSKYRLPDTDNPTTKWRWAPSSSWHVEGSDRNRTPPNGDKEKSAKRVGGGGGGDESGWVYFDNKWEDGRKTDGWGRYTRRRKWVRDAELVEVDPETGVESGQGGEGKDGTDTASIASSTAGNANTPTKLKKPAPGGGGGGGGSGSGGGGWFGGTSTPTTPTPTPSASLKPNNPNNIALSNKKPPRQSDAKKSITSISSANTDRSDAASTTGSMKSAGSTRSRASAAEDDTYTPLERSRRFDWDRGLLDGVAEQLS